MTHLTQLENRHLADNDDTCLGLIQIYSMVVYTINKHRIIWNSER